MLKQSVTYRLASVAEDAIRPAEGLFRARFGLDVHELRVLRLIDDEPGITFTALAARTKFERTSTSRILSRLVRSGLARRSIDPRDARSYRFTATARARAVRARADPLSLELEAVLLSPLSAGERRRFLAALEKLAAWVGGGYLPAMAAAHPDTRPAPARRRGGRR